MACLAGKFSFRYSRATNPLMEMPMPRFLSTLVLPLLLSSMAFSAQARDQIRIVGSSTVYPFISVVAEEFGKTSGFKTPIVESTGTGGGFKVFCSGAGTDTPDFSNASRPIKDSEKELCAKNGVKNVIEVPIGYDGIVIANAKASPNFNLTKKQVFLALAKQVPSAGKLVANPYRTWNEIDATLPKEPIEVYGPPPTSGTRDSFVELVMEESCKHFPEFKAAYPKEEDFKKACGLLREDGKYIEMGENDNVIVQKLTSNAHALGVFGYSFLEENGDSVKAASIEGRQPTFEDISSGSYGIARSVFIYAKGEHIGVVSGMKEFLRELTSPKAMGQEGYLADKGLVPLKEEQRSQIASKWKK